MKTAIVALLILSVTLNALPPGVGGGGSTPYRSVTTPAAGGGGGGGGCTTQQDQVTGSTAANVELGGSKFIATKFTAGANATICKIVIRGLKAMSPTYTVKAGIWTHNGGANFPNTKIDDSDTINASTFPTSEGDVEFSANLSASISSGTVYWVVVESSTEFNSPNVSSWAYTSSAGAHNLSASSDGSAWVEVSAFERCKFTLFSN